MSHRIPEQKTLNSESKIKGQHLMGLEMGTDRRELVTI